MPKYTFGPVPSRRLGFSLGVDIIPKKYCSFDCIYCQVGKTTNNTIQRKNFFDPQSIVEEIIESSKTKRHIDFITFSGSGEPTLCSDIGWMIKELKKYCHLPVAVITNSSLLWDKEVRSELVLADVILPSLDAASEDIFRFLNRPHPMIDLKMIVEGIKQFRIEYKGRLWLEIMLIDDINDDFDELEKLKKLISYCNPDKVQLNTITRPPLDETLKGIGNEQLNRICKYFGSNCEVIGSFKKQATQKLEDKADRLQWSILEMIGRRSLTLEDIVKVSGMKFQEVNKCLQKMEKEGKIKRRFFDDTVFFVKPDEE